MYLIGNCLLIFIVHGSHSDESLDGSFSVGSCARNSLLVTSSGKFKFFDSLCSERVLLDTLDIDGLSRLDLLSTDSVSRYLWEQQSEM